MSNHLTDPYYLPGLNKTVDDLAKEADEKIEKWIAEDMKPIVKFLKKLKSPSAKKELTYNPDYPEDDNIEIDHLIKKTVLTIAMSISELFSFIKGIKTKVSKISKL